jgi:hypothetical protein
VVIPIKRERDNPKVTTKWLVAVKLYGIIPIKLLLKRKRKVVKINGKYFLPSAPICSSTKLPTN